MNALLLLQLSFQEVQASLVSARRPAWLCLRLPLRLPLLILEMKSERMIMLPLPLIAKLAYLRHF